METIGEKTDSHVTSMRYGGFWVRLAAHIIDGFVVSVASMIIVIPLSIALSVFAAMDETRVAEFIAQAITSLVSMALGWGYYIFMTHKYQATLGKMAIGARVVAEDGQQLTLGNVILRETIGKIASGIILLVGYFMVGFTAKKQGLHDMIAKSVVVYTDEGPRKIVVGCVYGFYALIVFAFACLVGVLIFLGVLFGAAAYEDSQSGDNGTWQEMQDTDDMMPIFDDVSADQV